MHKSDLSRFSTPMFAIKHVHMGESSIILGVANQEYEVLCPSYKRQSLYNFLIKLPTLSSHEVKTIIQSSTADRMELITQLDAMGAIIDNQPSVDAEQLATFQSLVQRYKAIFSELLHQASDNDFWHKNITTNHQTNNFIATVLSWYVRHLKQFSPLSYQLIHYCISCSSGIVKQDEANLYDSMLQSYQLSFYSLHEVRCQVDAVTQLIADVLQNKVNYLMPPPIPVKSAMTGNNFILLAEDYITSSLTTVGENSLVHLLNEGVADVAAAKLWYLNQYYVTKRYAPTVTAILTHALSDSLRSLLQQYYNEEVGHEGLELKSCLALGLSQEEIDNYVALPYHVLFTDMLSAVSINDPLGYFASLYLVEGLDDGESISSQFYSQRDVNECLRFVGNEHDEINHEHNHHHLSRLLASQVALVQAEQAQRSLSCLRMMLEISYRSSECLYNEIVNQSNNR